MAQLYKTNPVSIESFLQALVAGQAVKDVLRLSDADFTEVSFEQLLQNAHDIGRGVTRAETKSDTLFFGMFTQLVVKHQENAVVFQFHGESRDSDSVIRIAQLLDQAFGGGHHDDETFSSFAEVDKVVSLAKGKFRTKRDQFLQTWIGDNYTISFGYFITPMRHLLLQVTQKSKAPLDTASRTKGTVADLLHLNLDKLLEQPEEENEITFQDGAIKFIDYFYTLDKPELGVFDRINIRIFGPEKHFDRQVQTTVVLTSSDAIDYRQMVRVAEKLIAMYGADHIGSKDLAAREIDDLQGDYWMGRMWVLNEVHAPFYPNTPGQKWAYDVALRHREDDNGFSLRIIGYNNLLNLFVAE